MGFKVFIGIFGFLESGVEVGPGVLGFRALESLGDVPGTQTKDGGEKK